MYRQPYRGLVGVRACYPVAAERGDEDVVPRFKGQGLRFIFKGDLGNPFQKDDPFIVVLVMPVVLRCCVAVRYDPLDLHVGIFGDRFKYFIGYSGRDS